MITTNGPLRLVAQMKSLTETSNGFRITSKLTSTQGSLITQFMPFKAFINERSGREGLRRNSEFYFNFDGSGFTGIVCFEGSHISIHTQPKEQAVYFESFLSDRILNNINIAETLYRETVSFFNSQVMSEDHQSL